MHNSQSEKWRTCVTQQNPPQAGHAPHRGTEACPHRHLEPERMLDFGQFDFGQFDFGQLAEVEIGRSRNWPKSNRLWFSCFLFFFFFFFLVFLFLVFFFFFSFSDSFCFSLYLFVFLVSPKPQNPKPQRPKPQRPKP